MSSARIQIMWGLSAAYVHVDTQRSSAVINRVIIKRPFV
jgi:hypothetical protein